jgi:hypothetical protein
VAARPGHLPSSVRPSPQRSSVGRRAAGEFPVGRGGECTCPLVTDAVVGEIAYSASRRSASASSSYSIRQYLQVTRRNYESYDERIRHECHPRRTAALGGYRRTF